MFAEDKDVSVNNTKMPQPSKITGTILFLIIVTIQCLLLNFISRYSLVSTI